ncbi:hypothetical protein HDA32_004079 [Spinactinospora alkalitolerans]|uniref:Uncharacterized protein n=1 Tax=Spinactinospora alkalitolerans TaxID=687207 RepID=A0A852TY84_9ACTN|nr:hypothetical protein [Spinactinospora alkalitolerans]NYE48959.1 hypothetical protein [Spinactinospora alkalitolerans]
MPLNVRTHRRNTADRAIPRVPAVVERIAREHGGPAGSDPRTAAPVGLRVMQPHRRKVLIVAVLVPSGLVALLGAFVRGAGFSLPGIVGVLVTLGVAAALVRLVLPGVDPLRGRAAVFVLGWGALVLAATAGETAATITGNELAQRGTRVTWSPSAQAEFGWFAYAPAGAESSSLRTWSGSETGASALTSVRPPMTGSILPHGTAASALLLGWAAGGAAAVAYTRTLPQEPPRAGQGDGGEQPDA